MSRLDNVIAQVKEVRNNKNRPWIFDEKGNVKDSVICGEVLELLEELKSYEINVTDEWIEDFLSNPNVKGDNTYNYNAKISNDINMNWLVCADGNVIYVMMVHLGGDIRGNYSEYFVVKYDFYELDSLMQTVNINDRYYADVDLLSEIYSVYDYEIDDYVGEFYSIEKSELIEEIKKTA